MLTFFMTPGSCTTGIHILLEEVEAIFSVELVNLLAGDQHSERYRALNPKGSIPMLQLDSGTVLTEFEAIACWIAWQYPRKKLLPTEPLQAAKVIELMSYCVNVLHMQAFARWFTPEKFCDSPDQIEQTKAAGAAKVQQGFAIVEAGLPEAGYACGEFSIADAALFYVAFWADRSGMAIPPKLRGHFNRMVSRPAVRQVLAEEGYRV